MQQHGATAIHFEVEVGTLRRIVVWGDEEFDTTVAADRVIEFLSHSAHILILHSEANGEPIVIVEQVTARIWPMPRVLPGEVRHRRFAGMCPEGIIRKIWRTQRARGPLDAVG